MRWLLRAWLAVFSVAIVVAVITCALWVHTEQAIRFAGLFLQLLGISAAALGIRDTRRMFGKPSILQSIRNWASSWPRFKPKPQYIDLSESASTSLSGFATLWRGVNPDAPLEEQISVLDTNLRDVERRVSVVESTISDNERAFRDLLLRETQERTAQDRALHDKIEAASTDGLHLAAAGAFWLAAGVVLSATSPDILTWCT